MIDSNSNLTAFESKASETSDNNINKLIDNKNNGNNGDLDVNPNTLLMQPAQNQITQYYMF